MECLNAINRPINFYCSLYYDNLMKNNFQRLHKLNFKRSRINQEEKRLKAPMTINTKFKTNSKSKDIEISTPSTIRKATNQNSPNRNNANQMLKVLI